MKISVIMPHFNRLKLLETTLRSIIEQTKFPRSEYEIVIVDDGSDVDQVPKASDYLGINVKIGKFLKEEKKWNCPCVPFNRAFELSKGERVILQSPECLHVGDILTHAYENVKVGMYYSYGAYQCSQEQNSKLAALKVMTKEKIVEVLQPIRNEGHGHDYDCEWYNHSKYRPVGYHFCSAISRYDMVELGGFDDRFRYGIGYDDDEFLFRIKQKGMEVSIMDDPFVVHQQHNKFNYQVAGSNLLLEKNRLLFEETKRLKIWKLKK
jgi:glycosyltransferase involved in cell wall biosynthesis